MFDTVGRVRQLAEERGLSIAELARLSGLNHSTFYTSLRRGGQLKIDTIDRLCGGLGISLAEFFSERRRDADA